MDGGDRLADAAACCDGLAAAPRFPHLGAAGEAETARSRLGAGAGAAFEQLVRDGGWRLALGDLVPFARMVTPAIEPKRFDTHFFLAELPAGQQARSDEVEADDLVWISPTEAVAGSMGGAVNLLPPTWVTLLQLTPFESVAALLAWGRTRPIVRVEPATASRADERLLSFPAGAILPPAGGVAATGELLFSFHESRGWRLDSPLG